MVTSRSCGLAALLLIVLTGAGCVTSRAQIPEQPPTLVVPPVPPRDIEPPVVVEPPVEPPPAPAPAPVVTKPSRPRPAADKPEPKPAEPPPDSGATLPAPQPVAPLRSAATPSGPEAERQIREILDTTQKLLEKVDLGTLEKSDDRKANFEQAKAFLRQADEALRKEELTQARSFAERAQNIAKQLQSGR